MSSGNERAPNSAARAAGTLNSSLGFNSGGNERDSNGGSGAVPRESLQSFLERTQAAQTCTRQDVSENLGHYRKFDRRFEFEEDEGKENEEDELKDELLETIEEVEEVDEDIEGAVQILLGIKNIQSLFLALDEGDEAAGEPLEQNLVGLIDYGRDRRERQKRDRRPVQRLIL